jgi:transcriptional regulator with XRE-family HTH domain
MDTSAVVARARISAGLSQRELARVAGMAQPAIARIERGAVAPKVQTLLRLLRACGHDIEVVREPGQGIDRTQIRRLLQLTPRQRLDLAVEEARALDRFLEAAG